MPDVRYGVTITHGSDGAVTIVPNGTPDATGVLTHRLPVSGGTLSTSVGDAALLLAARIDDLHAAAWWLEFVYGREVAEAAATVQAGESVEAAAVTTALSDASSRLLLGSWLQRWWPAEREGRVEEWLIDAELGALAWRTEELFGDLSLATAHFESPGVLPQLADAVVGLSAREIDLEAPIPAAVLRAARAAVDFLPIDEPDFARLENAFLELQQRDPAARNVFARLLDWISSSVVSVGEQLAEAISSPTPSYIAGADEGDVVAVGDAVVDWRNVHPRSIDRGRNAARWEIADHDGRTIRVVVSRGYATYRDPSDLLYARVTGAQDPIGVALDDLGNEYVGVAALPADTDAADVTVDILSLRHGDPTRPVADERTARTVESDVAAFLRERAETVRVGRADGTAAEAFAFERTALELAAAS